AAARAGATVAILGDLQGPKLRIGDVPPGFTLRSGECIVLATEEAGAQMRSVPMPHPELVAACHPGQPLLLDDGALELVVESVAKTELGCRVETGGVLSSRKGISAPGADIEIPSLTPKDREDLRFLARQRVDAVGLSFVRRADDIEELRAALQSLSFAPEVVAKIEKRQAIENFTAILAASDVIMVARGDLGVEIPPEDVPLHQKDIIRACNRAAKPVITATQMLQSM
ncbi:MAG: pyruvate kinase, partial [Steroidobacteraceae bacterium]